MDGGRSSICKFSSILYEIYQHNVPLPQRQSSHLLIALSIFESVSMMLCLDCWNQGQRGVEIMGVYQHSLCQQNHRGR